MRPSEYSEPPQAFSSMGLYMRERCHRTLTSVTYNTEDWTADFFVRGSTVTAYVLGMVFVTLGHLQSLDWTDRLDWRTR